MWMLKIFLKISISILPFGLDWWKRFGIFKTGNMLDMNYALSVATKHIVNKKYSKNFKYVMEIGPGDSLYSALIAFKSGANVCYFLDHYPHAKAGYTQVTSLLKENLIDTSKCSIYYWTDGLNAFTKLHDSEIDFIWSHTVLQHIPKEELAIYISEMFRVLSPGGVMSHKIDYKDCISGGLNNLRFSNSVWESSIFRSSGFYTNRTRHNQMIKLFLSFGFEIIENNITYFDKLPISKKALSKDFSNLTESDLMVSGCHIVARKRT